jgi:hypothetical protein
MKYVIFKLAGIAIALFLISVASLPLSSLHSQTMPMKDRFYVGYQGDYYAPMDYEHFHFPGIYNLNSNFIQVYGHRYESGNPTEGGFKDPIDSYSDNIGIFLDHWSSTFGNKALFMEREKVKRAGFGQLSDYQAEYVPSTIKPRYGYENRGGTPFEEVISGETIRGIFTGLPDNIGYWFVSGLYENREQIDYPRMGIFDTNNNSWNLDYYYSDVKTDQYKWFVMPRMKINASDAHGPEKPVCRVTIISYNGTEYNFELSTNDFRLSGGGYNGEYIDIFYENGTFAPISITGFNLNNRNTPDQNGKSQHPELSQVDYKIKWYGEVELWIDRVRVADEWAFYLFHPELDILQTDPYKFEIKTAEECTNGSIGGHQSFGYFYIDEHRYNNLPCIAKMNEIIKNVKPNSGMISETNISLLRNYSGLKYPPSPDEVSGYLMHLGLINYYSLSSYKPVCL